MEEQVGAKCIAILSGRWNPIGLLVSITFYTSLYLYTNIYLFHNEGDFLMFTII